MNRFDRWLDRFTVGVLLALVAGGLVVRTHFPSVPIADGDTWGYLRPALCWLSGLGFQQTYGRDWLYPALLAGILRVTGHFSGIVYVQQSLGLASILIFWSTWRSWMQLLPRLQPAVRSVCSIITILLVALCALGPQQALLQNTIRPEGMVAFFEMVFCYCLVSFFRARWGSRRVGSTILFGAATIGLSYAILLLKPSWGLAFGFTLLVMIASATGAATRWIRFGPLLGGTGAFLFLFVLPKILGFQQDSRADLFLPFTLVSIHAPQILESSPGELRLNQPGPGMPDQQFYEKLSEYTA